MIGRNPWKRISSREIYSNPWITVREDQVIRPDGKEGIYGVVDTRIAVGVVALTPEHDIYLVGQWRYPLDIYSWEIVEGGTDPGEEPLETAKRELVEEAGLIAESWAPLGPKVHLSNCFTSEEAVFFLAKDLHETEASPDGTEELVIKKTPFQEALNMVETGEISDAMTVIALERMSKQLP